MLYDALHVILPIKFAMQRLQCTPNAASVVSQTNQKMMLCFALLKLADLVTKLNPKVSSILHRARYRESVVEARVVEP